MVRVSWYHIGVTVLVSYSMNHKARQAKTSVGRPPTDATDPPMPSIGTLAELPMMSDII